jgi:uncharacterized protein YjiS (DUF1127 family)
MNNTVIKPASSNVVRGEFQRSFLSRFLGKIKSWNENRVAIRQLESLSDRLLQDIGINRGQIHEAVTRQGVFAKIVPGRADSSRAKPEVRQAA